MANTKTRHDVDRSLRMPGSVLEAEGDTDDSDQFNAAMVQSNFGWYLDLQGKYEEEEAMHRRALDAREKMLGLEHPDTLTSVNDLGLVLDSQGKYEEAEVMYRRAIDSREKVLGFEHPETLRSMNILSDFIKNHGKRG